MHVCLFLPTFEQRMQGVDSLPLTQIDHLCQGYQFIRDSLVHEVVVLLACARSGGSDEPAFV